MICLLPALLMAQDFGACPLGECTPFGEDIQNERSIWSSSPTDLNFDDLVSPSSFAYNDRSMYGTGDAAEYAIGDYWEHPREGTFKLDGFLPHWVPDKYPYDGQPHGKTYYDGGACPHCGHVGHRYVDGEFAWCVTCNHDCRFDPPAGSPVGDAMWVLLALMLTFYIRKIMKRNETKQA